MNYTDWEDEVIYELQNELDLTRGDAQGIVEASGGVMAESWSNNLSPSEGAMAIINRAKTMMAGGGSVPQSTAMLLSQAKEAKHHAEELKNVVDKHKPTEAWVLGKMERATTDLSDVTHYMDGKTEYAKGGIVRYIDPDTISFESGQYPYYKRFNGAIGSFAWEYNGRYNEGIIYPLDDFDKQYYAHLNLKVGEQLFRYKTDNMIFGERYLIKMNVDRALLYFMDSVEDDKNPTFQNRGIKAQYIVIERKKAYKDGGSIPNRLIGKRVEMDSEISTIKSARMTSPNYEHIFLYISLEDGTEEKIKESQIKPFLNGEYIILRNTKGEPYSIKLINEYAQGGKMTSDSGDANFDMNAFLMYAHKEISYFLATKIDGRMLDEDWTFIYQNKQYFIEALINIKSIENGKLKKAVFVITDDREEEVGEIHFYNGTFTANSESFDWLDEKFKDGGKVCNHKCECEECKSKKDRFEDGGQVMMQANYVPTFVNDKIYRNECDYILGGFTTLEYDSIAVSKDNSPLPMAKIELIAQDRIKKAIESYREEVTSYMVDYPNSDILSADDVFYAQINEMMQLYLKTTFIGNSTEKIFDTITTHDTFKYWINTISERVQNFNNTNISQPIFNSSSKLVDMSDIQELTENFNLDLMLEQLSMLNDIK